MIQIRAWSNLGHLVVTIEHVDVNEQLGQSSKAVTQLAYVTAPELAHSEDRMLLEAITAAINVGNERAAALGWWAALV